MSGVGSTNAMKKGSANNPFLAFSEADMKGYLNSAYTGCIVKYNGDPIVRNLSDTNKTAAEYAQNLVFDGKHNPVYNWGCLKITKKATDGTETVQYLRTLFYNHYTKELTWETNNSANWVSFIAICNTQHPTSTLDVVGIKFLWVPATYQSNPDNYPLYWPVTLGWQGENVDADGKITLWGYGEDVSFVYLEDGKDDIITYASMPCVITPYIPGELYKVVYGDNEYYYEEFYYISEERTTAGVEDVAPGKTFYDFAGTKQTGTGTRANPFLARTDTQMNAFNSATYLGKFVKYIGKTNNTYINNAIYQVTNDATEYDRYMLLPTLENEAQPSELAEGKELISSLGAVVVGTGNVVLKAATTEGMQALFTEENIGKLVQYLGDSDVYIKDAIYQIVDTSDAKQYYELPALTSEGTADDLALGKELINSKGEKVTGTRPGKLNDTSWSDIRTIILSGKAGNYWSIGDTKQIISKSGDTYTIRLCDLQEGRYDYSNGNGKSKAVFEFVELYNYNSIIAQNMNLNRTNEGGYADSDLRQQTLQQILNTLPDDMVSAMSEVKVLSGVGGGTSSGVSSSDNKIFLPADMELYSTRNASIGIAECPLGQFDYYKTNNLNAFRTKSAAKVATTIAYWLRSPYINSTTQFCVVGNTGANAYAYADVNRAILLFFAI